MSRDSILVVDDDESICETLSDILELQGYEVRTAQSGEAAERAITAHPADAALVDLRLPDRSGLDVLRFIKTHSPETEVLMVSGHATLASAIDAMRYGAVGYVQKPIEVDEVLSGLKQALDRQRMARALRRADAEQRKRVRALELLLESVCMASSRLELAEVLQVLAEQMVRKLGISLCHIAVLEEDQAHLRIRAIYPVREVPWGLRINSRFPLTESPTYRRAVARREVVQVRAGEPDQPVEMDLALAAAADARSAVLVPMLVREQIVGVVTAFDARRWEQSAFSAEKVSLCTAMASGAAVAIENALLFKDREQGHLATLTALVSALDTGERETETHACRVQHYTLALARAMGVPEPELNAIAAGAILHDIGKIGIAEATLLKRGGLNDEEWATVRRHPAMGEEIVRGLRHLSGAREIVLSHQERWDGSGYPHGLQGEAIPLGARIFAVADTLDAITSDRPYREKKSWAQARDEIVECAGKQFDPKVVEAFLAIPLDEWAEIQREAERAGQRRPEGG
ncbi:MAG TPA: HD domain-containing phosphohydrolase [Candidatus Sulfotelmatobacter sp.]|nr:HD domain-containing phosphohydrolase [Candidatus Sulfotelmatobacter sp.]